MATSYDEAVAELYQAPHGEFVAERKRLAGALATAGDKASAALFAKLPRPSVSAWATNQLFWQEREDFDELLATGEQLREGDLTATAAHRKLLTKLVGRAGEILSEAGHGASEGTLRRVSANLSALAAANGFDPDPPGALKSDRDPPGFDALAFGAAEPKAQSPKAQAKGKTERRSDETDGAETRAAAAAERRRFAEEQARTRAERRRLEGALRSVKADIEKRTRERERLRSELAAIEAELETSSKSEQDLESRLAALAPES